MRALRVGVAASVCCAAAAATSPAWAIGHPTSSPNSDRSGGRDDGNTVLAEQAGDAVVASVARGGAVYGATNGDWSVSYSIDVTNLSGAESNYTLSDVFRFAPSVDVSAGWPRVTAASSDGHHPSIRNTGSRFDGVDATTIVSNEPIGPGATHTYTVSVLATVDEPADDDGRCDLVGAGPGGFLNFTTLSDGPPLVTCVEFGVLTLESLVANQFGGELQESEVKLFAYDENDEIAVSGFGLTSAAVPVGEYRFVPSILGAVFEFEGAPAMGYRWLGATCDGVKVLEPVVVVSEGETVNCTLVLKDVPEEPRPWHDLPWSDRL